MTREDFTALLASLMPGWTIKSREFSNAGEFNPPQVRLSLRPPDEDRRYFLGVAAKSLSSEHAVAIARQVLSSWGK